jgi:cell fate (sporulation/competence/biofilm development) regulator YmcA (YheA/YmcA/DUF963 family)
MADPIQATSNAGIYTMDNANMDIDTIMMTIGAERADGIEQQMVDQANAMKSRNTEISELNNVLAQVSAIQDNDTLFDANTATVMVDGKSMSVKDFFKQEGIPMLSTDAKSGADWKWGKEEKAEAVQVIKGKLDSLNSDSQMDMIRLQGLVNKRDQAFDMITNLMDKFSKTMDTIVGNMR